MRSTSPQHGKAKRGTAVVVGLEVGRRVQWDVSTLQASTTAHPSPPKHSMFLSDVERLAGRLPAVPLGADTFAALLPVPLGHRELPAVSHRRRTRYRDRACNVAFGGPWRS